MNDHHIFHLSHIRPSFFVIKNLKVTKVDDGGPVASTLEFWLLLMNMLNRGLTGITRCLPFPQLVFDPLY